MRRLFKNIFVASLAILCIGCNPQDNPVNDGGYVVRLELCCDEAQVRATKPGEDAYNENLMQAVDCFLYKNGQTGSSAFLSKHYTLKATTSSIVEFSMTGADFDALVSDGGTCEVFVIANMPDSLTLPSVTSIANLKNLGISENFKTKEVLDNFVMSGQATVTRSGDEAAGVVNLSRAASKLTMDITTASTFVEQRSEGDITWTSQPSAMKVAVYNCNSGSTIAAADGSTLFNYDKRAYKKGKPWYSYPRSWTTTNPFYIVVTLPWTRPVDPLNPSAGTKFQNCYYKIILNEDELNPNTWYHIKANIKVLGSFYEDTPTVTLPDEIQYYAVDWKPGVAGGTDFNTDAVIKDAGFLTVPENNYVLDNVNTIQIPYSSNAKCVVSCVCTYDTFTSTDFKHNTLPASDYSINCDNGVVTLTHDLQNDINLPDFDYYELTYTITLQHEDNPAYNEVITVKQRPAIVITGEKNLADVNQKTKSTVIVNGNKKMAKWWYNVTTSTSYSNPFMYIVEVSKTDDYVIGDPRTTTAQTRAQLGIPDSAAVSAPAFYHATGTYYANPTGHTRQLQFYYKTKEDASVSNMISPKFRIASQMSNCNSYYTNMQQTQWRCATYQEYGHPAGRWRVPTGAEIKIIGVLSSKGVFPSPFIDGARYWASDGVYTYSSSDGTFTGPDTNATGLSRCVYDEWYWEQSDYARLTDSSTPNYTNFVWGDMPREYFK